MSALNKLSGYRVNEQIKAPQVRLLDVQGKQIGVMSTIEALKVSKEQGNDLIEIAPQAMPPVVKSIQIGKFKYQLEKKERAESQKQKGGELKEIRFSPFIAANDYETRLNRINEFLADKNKVKVVVVFRSNQLSSKQFGYEILARVARELGEKAHIDVVPKFMGRQLFMIISPRSQKKGNIENAKDENQKINS